MIQSFRCDDTEALYYTGKNRRVTNIKSVARRKLDYLDAAETIEDLRVPPGSRLERLSGNRKGQWSIQINNQWRLCFSWQENDVYGVEIVDYH